MKIIFFIPILIWLIIYHRGQFLLLVAYLSIPVISILLWERFRGEGWNYLDFVRFGIREERVKLLSSILKRKFDPLLKKILSCEIQSVALIIELYLFVYFAPTFSLIIWLYLIYFFATFIIEAAFHFGEMLSVLTSDYNKFVLKDREIEGFVAGRDQDHYFLMTENGTVSIFT